MMAESRLLTGVELYFGRNLYLWAGSTIFVRRRRQYLLPASML